VKPPLVPRALVAAVATQSDYECLAGDLCEEYSQRVESFGAAAADRWYWSQALRSVPTLLVLSRSDDSLVDSLKIGALVVATLVATILVGALANGALDSFFNGSYAPLWLHFAASWSIVLLAGYALAYLARRRSVRLAIGAALFFVAAFAIPSALGLSGRIYPLAWLLLLGTIPAMTAGASLGHVLRRL